MPTGWWNDSENVRAGAEGKEGEASACADKFARFITLKFSVVVQVGIDRPARDAGFTCVLFPVSIDIVKDSTRRRRF